LQGRSRIIRGNVCHIERRAEERKFWSCKIGLDLDDCDLDDGNGDDFDAYEVCRKKNYNKVKGEELYRNSGTK